MRRIQPPKCTCCQRANAVVESDVWSSLRVCYECQRLVIEYLIQNDCAIHGNPFAIEFALPGDNGNRSDAIRVWRKVENHNHAYAEFFVRLRDHESTIAVDNSLDILDEIC